eukprot:g47822.t1
MIVPVFLGLFYDSASPRSPFCDGGAVRLSRIDYDQSKASLAYPAAETLLVASFFELFLPSWFAFPPPFLYVSVSYWSLKWPCFVSLLNEDASLCYGSVSEVTSFYFRKNVLSARKMAEKCTELPLKIVWAGLNLKKTCCAGER